MTQHPRLLIPGPTYFFTVRLEAKGSTLLTDHIESLRYAYARAMQDFPVTCHAMVVLPDHLHAVWTEPEGGIWYAERWRRIKSRFATAIPETGQPSTAAEGVRRPGIWQRRFAEHAIRSAQDLNRAVAYCHDNPVKHGLVSDAAHWPFSSLAKRRAAGRFQGAGGAAEVARLSA